MANPSVPVSDGGDLLAQEIREEVGRLIHHPIDEVKRLEHVAADGESATTPLLTVLGVGLFLAVVFAIVTALAMAVYYWV
jgi:hypothetical protein